MAAGFVGECFDHGNFDAEVMSIWHDRWMEKFGNDYKWSECCDTDNRHHIFILAAFSRHTNNFSFFETLAGWVAYAVSLL